MKVTLDDIRAAAERKYGDYEIDLGDRTLLLRHALRLPEKQRDQLLELITSVKSAQDTEDPDVTSMLTLICDALRLLASRTEDADVLIGLIGDDLTMLMEIFEGYLSVAMPGEASPSDG